MTACEVCGAEYSSPLAAAECEETDRQDDLRNRQWIANKRTTND